MSDPVLRRSEPIQSESNSFGLIFVQPLQLMRFRRWPMTKGNRSGMPTKISLLILLRILNGRGSPLARRATSYQTNIIVFTLINSVHLMDSSSELKSVKNSWLGVMPCPIRWNSVPEISSLLSYWFRSWNCSVQFELPTNNPNIKNSVSLGWDFHDWCHGKFGSNVRSGDTSQSCTG
jgi:hypothetical protein